MKIIPVRFSAEHLEMYSVFLKKCFPDTLANRRKFSVDSLKWLYTLNPEGSAIGFDAFDEGKLVAHYVCIPTSILGPSKPMKALLSLNTATSKEYQGRGLFTQLALATFFAARQVGFECVYGVANQNSTLGFVQKLGFTLISPLKAMIGIGSLKVPKSNLKLQFQRNWSYDFMNWRCNNPANPVRSCQHKDKTVYWADTEYAIIVAYDEQWGIDSTLIPPCHNHLKIKLILGLFPQGMPMSYFKIPDFLKPSPLNFIYKSLQPTVSVPDHDSVLLTFLDFDAY